MENILNKDIFLLTNQDDVISLFDNEQMFETYQLRMGLDCLCQNTLVYPIKKVPNGDLDYKIKSSPNSKIFYNSDCVEYCRTCDGSNSCNQMMLQIAKCFCENNPIDKLGILDVHYYPYNEEPNNFVCYQCPFVKLYKCAFPIYVENTVVAVLFTGQFNIGDSVKSSYLKKIIKTTSEEDTFNKIKEKFKQKDDLVGFIRSKLLPIVFDFSKKSRENLFKQRKAILSKKINNQIASMEEMVAEFLSNLNYGIGEAETKKATQNDFWTIISNCIAPYLKMVNAYELLVFIDDQTLTNEPSSVICGIQLNPYIEQNCSNTFDFSWDNKYTNSIYTRNNEGDLINEVLFNHISNKDIDYSSEQYDIIARFGKLQPFAVVIRYLESSKIINYGKIRRTVLEHLETFFLKVGQELVHLSVRKSEQINKSVLRIYRHEIIHQIEVLNHNNLFLDMKKLKETDENKLRHVAEDQRQCIHELDFITHNINVFTGKLEHRLMDVDKGQSIDVGNDIINKAISLYQRAKRDKCLWFSVQNTAANDVINTNLSLLDMIFFNLMSNAIKYAYSGTKIVIGFNDRMDYNRPHSISLTDFGSSVDADYQTQVFQMYFRGNNTYGQIEGSGLGLYVANEVARVLDAKLTWTCDKISDYNVPILMRYLHLMPGSIDLVGISDQIYFLAKKEYNRLKDNSILNQAVNINYLENPEKWSKIEIQEDLLTPTYKVTFEIQL